MNEQNFKVVIDCPICGEHELQVVNDDSKELMQCINCGYSTSSDMSGTMEDCENFKKIDSNLKKWAKEAKGHVWLPSVLNLELGVFYPTGDDEMIWAFAPLVEIPEEEQKNYPTPDGGYFKTKYDLEKEITFDGFAEGLLEINRMTTAIAETKNISKQSQSVRKNKGVKLPSLRKKPLEE